jgi:hypothetical protein
MQVTTSIVELDLSSTRLALDSCDALSKGIVKNSSLHTLRMHGAEDITETEVQELARVLRDHPGLKHIQLTNCKMSHSCGEAWGAMLETNSVLQHLTLADFKSRESSFVRIGLALAKNSALRLLHLHGNLTKQDMQAIGQGLGGNTTLRTLQLAGPSLGLHQESLLEHDTAHHQRSHSQHDIAASPHLHTRNGQ